MYPVDLVEAVSKGSSFADRLAPMKLDHESELAREILRQCWSTYELMFDTWQKYSTPGSRFKKNVNYALTIYFNTMYAHNSVLAHFSMGKFGRVYQTVQEAPQLLTDASRRILKQDQDDLLNSVEAMTTLVLNSDKIREKLNRILQMLKQPTPQSRIRSNPKAEKRWIFLMQSMKEWVKLRQANCYSSVAASQLCQWAEKTVDNLMDAMHMSLEDLGRILNILQGVPKALEPVMLPKKRVSRKLRRLLDPQTRRRIESSSDIDIDPDNSGFLDDGGPQLRVASDAPKPYRMERPRSRLSSNDLELVPIQRTSNLQRVAPPPGAGALVQHVNAEVKRELLEFGSRLDSKLLEVENKITNLEFNYQTLQRSMQQQRPMWPAGNGNGNIPMMPALPYYLPPYINTRVPRRILREINQEEEAEIAARPPLPGIQRRQTPASQNNATRPSARSADKITDERFFQQIKENLAKYKSTREYKQLKLDQRWKDEFFKFAAKLLATTPKVAAELAEALTPESERLQSLSDPNQIHQLLAIWENKNGGLLEAEDLLEFLLNSEFFLTAPALEQQQSSAQRRDVAEKLVRKIVDSIELLRSIRRNTAEPYPTSSGLLPPIN